MATNNKKIWWLWAFIIFSLLMSLYIDSRTCFEFNFFGRAGGMIAFFSVFFPYISIGKVIIAHRDGDSISSAIKSIISSYGLLTKEEKLRVRFGNAKFYSIVLAALVGSVVNNYGEFIKFLF